MPTSRLRALGLVIALLAASALAACGTPWGAKFVQDGEPRTFEDVERSAEQADISSVSGLDKRDAPAARTDVLVWLRRQGTDGERAAMLLTRGFPDQTAAVPVLVEIAKVDGERSLVAVEAYADREGKMTRRRLWVFEFSSGRLVRSVAFE